MAAEKEDTKKEADAKATKVRDRDVTPPAPPPTRPAPNTISGAKSARDPRAENHRHLTTKNALTITYKPASDAITCLLDLPT